MRVLWNGEALEEFSPMRGVWKGDPISPYFLFFFLRDYSTLLMPQYLKFYGSPFSLTEVALFTKADVRQADIIKTALDVFCESSWEKLKRDWSLPRIGWKMLLLGMIRQINGLFSIKSAYRKVAGFSNDKDLLFNLIWSWKGPERMRILLWKIANEGLLTNKSRVTRAMAESSECPRCHLQPESILHCLRDCFYAKQVWNTLSGNSLNHLFCAHDCPQWLVSNLRSPQNCEENNWALFFVITISFIWKARNEMIFSNRTQSASELVGHIPRMALEVIQSLSVENKIHWHLPPPGKFKLNCDAAVDNMGNAAIVGVIRV
ncbi:Putative ribonuclease H protein [Glycine soja]|uniref:Putative ribonuclease H protein n=1 Tax=Glycine soja TaxID=3848 RepID=A0A0B2QRI6_GLYSO|nr:Putative ribonuclease H protein [Glycine soja]